jgi:hypothetical protein
MQRYTVALLGETTMPFRRQRKITWVALIAMAIQLVVSFGHVHGDRLPHPADANNLSAAVDEQGAPAQSQDLNGSCALCWLMQVAGTLVLPELTSLPVRATHWEGPPPTPALPLPLPDRLYIFQARGPPPASV